MPLAEIDKVTNPVLSLHPPPRPQLAGYLVIPFRLFRVSLLSVSLLNHPSLFFPNV